MQGLPDAPGDILALSLLQVGQMLVQSGSASSLQEGVRRAKATIDDGSALGKFKEMVAAQGGMRRASKTQRRFQPRSIL